MVKCARALAHLGVVILALKWQAVAGTCFDGGGTAGGLLLPKPVGFREVSLPGEEGEPVVFTDCREISLPRVL